jgi:hypothetical protein
LPSHRFQEEFRIMKRTHTFLALALLALPAAAGGDRVPAAPQPTPALQQGMVIVVDGAGKIVQAPQATDVRAILGNAVSTSSQGLVETPSPVPGGGTMVDLQGRFQNAMTMQIDEHGNVTAPCLSGAAAAGEVK